SFRNQFTP
ncbi:hypothetical protein CP8484711_2160B, partial [Chlamydia psittaci 84-8471/1]